MIERHPHLSQSFHRCNGYARDDSISNLWNPETVFPKLNYLHRDFEFQPMHHSFSPPSSVYIFETWRNKTTNWVRRNKSLMQKP